MAFRILRKKDLAKKPKLVLHSLTQERSISLGWSLMQLAAFGQGANLKISLNVKPVWLKKNLELGETHLYNRATPYFWNMALSSTLLPLRIHSKQSFYRNLNFFGEFRKGDFQTQHSSIFKSTYFSWLSIYFRSAFLNKRGLRLNTVILANTLFYNNIISLTPEKSYFFTDLGGLWIGTVFPFLSLSLPFSSRTLYSTFYPFFLVSEPLFSRINYSLNRYFFYWQQSVVYPDENVSLFEINYSFFSTPAHINLKGLRKSDDALLISERINYNCLRVCESAEGEFVSLINSVDSDLEAGIRLGDEYFADVGVNVTKNEALVNVSYGIYLGWLSRYWSSRSISLFGESSHGVLRVLKLDADFWLKRVVELKSHWRLNEGFSVKLLHYDAQDFNYRNVTNPFWLFFQIVRVFLFQNFWFSSLFSFSCCLISRGFCRRILHFIYFIFYLFYIRVTLLRFLVKNLLKDLINLDLIFYAGLCTRYLIDCGRVLLTWFYFPGWVRGLTNLNMSASSLIFFVLTVWLVAIGAGGLIFFFIILFVEVCIYLFYRGLVNSPTFARLRPLDEVFKLLRPSFSYYIYGAKNVVLSGIKLIWYDFWWAISSAVVGLWLKNGVGLATNLDWTRRKDHKGLRVEGGFNRRLSLQLMQLLFTISVRRCFAVCTRFSVMQNFFDGLYALFVCNPVTVFWFYFSAILNIFGSFGWWLNAALVIPSAHLVARASYFYKLLQQSLVPGYYISQQFLAVRSVWLLNIIFIEVLFIRNYLNPRVGAWVLSKLVASIGFDTLPVLRVNQTFADILGERFLSTIFSVKQLRFFSGQSGFRVSSTVQFILRCRLRPLLLLVNVFSFFFKMFGAFARLLVLFGFLLFGLLLIFKFVLLLWAASAYAVLKGFWLFILASSFMSFVKKM